MKSTTHKSRNFFGKFIPRPLFRILLCMLSLCLFGGCQSSAMVERPDRLTHARDEQTSASIPTFSPQPYKKRVALTFDDGPQYANDGETAMLVDELAKYGFHATFFVIGNRIANGSALSYAVEHGNEIGIHGFTHTQDSDHYYDTAPDEIYRNEIENTADAIKRAVPGYDVRLMRPVGGRISSERIASSPYSIIMWSVDSKDWANTYHRDDTDEEARERVDTIVENVMSSVSDGDIILMHDIYQSTYDAAVIILQRLYEEGYEVVTVSELFDGTLQAGQAYYSR